MLMKTNVVMNPVFNFRKWLFEQTPERKREIEAAERRWLADRRQASPLMQPLADAFEESMTGYQETPAGTRDPDDPLGLDSR